MEFGQEGGFFGRPIFKDPEAHALARVGVIDIGSNSVRMVVFDGAARSPAYFYNEKVMCGLGRGLARSGTLHPEGRERAVAAIRRFVLLAEGMGLPPLTAVATAAVREASDGPDFQREVMDATGLNFSVIDGPEEARLSAQGVLLGWPGATGLVCDIGGSSMELARLDKGNIGACYSSTLGPLRLRTLRGGSKVRRSAIDAGLDELAKGIEHHDRLYLVGGSWRAIARLDMHRRGYPLSVLHDYRVKPKQLRKTLEWLKGEDLEVVRKETRLSADRIALVPIAGEVLRRLMAKFGTREVVISSYGIREGMLFEQMPAHVRARDPLIEACLHEEEMRARVPGFGRQLYHFIRPLMSRRKVSERLIRAACLLHDINWRAHPDYRADVCFDAATRGNLGGLDHRGRVFLGLALLYRYRNGRSARFTPLLDLLTDEDCKDAEILGRALRFGAMFSAATDTRMGHLHHRPKRQELILTLPKDVGPLFGEVAAARFQSLADAMLATPIVKFEKA